MTGSVYEKYTLFGETFGALREDFQVQLEAAKKSANTCTVIILRLWLRSRKAILSQEQLQRHLIRLSQTWNLLKTWRRILWKRQIRRQNH